MVSRSREFFITQEEFIALIDEVAGRFRLAVMVYESSRTDEFLRKGDAEQRDFIARGGGPGAWTRALFLCQDVRRQLREACQSAAEVSKVFLSEGEVDSGAIDPENIVIGKLAWLQSDIPKTEGATLYMCQFGTKSDWFDKESGQVFENSNAIRLFEKVWAATRKHLHYPVWTYNALKGAGTARADQKLGYTAGVDAWIRGGGEIRQEGVTNVRFALVKPRAV